MAMVPEFATSPAARRKLRALVGSGSGQSAVVQLLLGDAIGDAFALELRCLLDFQMGVSRIGVPRNGWGKMENLLKWMIWGYPYFWKPPNE